MCTDDELDHGLDEDAREFQAPAAEVPTGVTGAGDGRSWVATWSEPGWEAPDRPVRWIGSVYGLVVHTTGGGVPSTARRRGIDPVDVALDAYRRSHGCHYLLGWGGTDVGELLQIAGERAQANGVGMSNKADRNKDQKRSIAEGRFEHDLPSDLVERWRARWPGAENPLDLLPGTTTANSSYVHLECIPCVWAGGVASAAKPMRPGVRFTTQQHDAVADLAIDVAQRNGWPADEHWWRTPRLLGHEDLTPISRHNEGGGWDPGYLRERPFFDWDYVYVRIGSLLHGAFDGSSPHPLADDTGHVDVAGDEAALVGAAIEDGIDDENTLTNLVFLTRHPELGGRSLEPDEHVLAAEWIEIRNDVVRSLLDDGPRGD